jgi:Ser/Thr protein kinase RdoA (MazF antagonist)
MQSTGARPADPTAQAAVLPGPPTGLLAGAPVPTRGHRRLHPVAAGDPPVTGVPVRELTAAGWGVRARRVVRLGGDRNVHWRVSCAEGEYVLRCYRADRDAAAIAYEFAVIAHLATAGWPVAGPVGPPTVWRGRTFALFPRLAGRTWRGPERLHSQRHRGTLLAHLHGDLGPLTLGQRSGWRRLEDFIHAEADRLIRAAQARLRDRPALRELLVRHTVATRSALADCPADLPRSVVHGDFVPWNLLRTGGRLTGVIDFDDVRFDLRCVDVAIARRRDRDAVVAGYRRHIRLADEELRLIAPLWRAYTLMLVADLLRAPTFTSPVTGALRWAARELEATRPLSRW